MRLAALDLVNLDAVPRRNARVNESMQQRPADSQSAKQAVSDWLVLWMLFERLGRGENGVAGRRHGI